MRGVSSRLFYLSLGALLALGGVLLLSHRSGAAPGLTNQPPLFSRHIPAVAVSAASATGLRPARQPAVQRSEVVRSAVQKPRPAPYEAWDLSAEQWSRYLELMRGPRGFWSPQLDPISMLGVHAAGEEERLRLAERFVLLQDRRVQGELAFQRTVNEVLERFYGGAPTPPPPAPQALQTPEQTPERTQSRTGLKSDDGELMLLAPISCRTQCRELLEQAQQAMREQRKTLHIYLADAVDDDAIRHWALGMGVDRRAVFERRITLNHQDEALQHPMAHRFAGAEPRLLLRRNDSLQEYVP